MINISQHKNSFVLTLLATTLFFSGCTDNSQAKDKGIAEASSLSSDTVSSELISSGQVALEPAAIKTILEKKLPGISVSSVEPSPKEGIYQVIYNGQMLYVTDDGMFLFTGNLLGLSEQQPVNLTEIAMYEKAAELSPQRAVAIAAIDEKDMVVFKAADEKHMISVFTDVDCAYCRKLHKEVPQLNAAGVTVRYLAFPRAGVGSSAYDKLVSVWCADDKQQAMNNSKLKRQFSPKSCDNPIADQYQLTRDFGLSGTPALILSDGELISGYVPHVELIKHLEGKLEQGSEKEEENPDSTGK